MSLNKPLIDRLMDAICQEGDCWVWQKALSQDGYARITYDWKSINAHRLSYQVFIGEIPEGLQIDHLCRNRKCINPDHLEAVTIKTNLLRGEGLMAKNLRKTHCKNGHEFTDENTYVRPLTEWRTCRTCVKESQLKYKERVYA